MMMGRIMMFSISNTKNRTASRKNRKEKGRRAFDVGVNPHSKGAAVSRSLYWGGPLHISSAVRRRMSGGIKKAIVT